MQQICKRMLSVLLAVAVLLSLTVTAFAADGDADTVLTAADYAAADALFDALDGVEQTAAQRDASTADARGNLRLSQCTGRGRLRFGRDERRPGHLVDGAGDRLRLFSPAGADRGRG